MKQHPKLEYVEWKDPTSHEIGWVPLTSYATKDVIFCKSVGWVIYEGRGKDGNLTIVPHLTTDENGHPCDGSGDIVIPKSLIVRRKVLDAEPTP